MNRRFRCGRLALTRDGIIKKLSLEEGGGCRFCKWDPIDMDFDSIHRSLLDIFKLEESQLKTSLYDFRQQPLDINQYNTFLEYVNKNGLNCHSTIIYLCAHQAHDNDNQIMILKKKKETSVISPSSSSSSISNSLNPQQKISILAEATSSTTSIENKHVDTYENECDQEQTYQSYLYSFEKSTNDLVNNIRIFINQYGFDQILIELFEYICIIQGYVRSLIHPLNQKIQNFTQNFQLHNPSEIKLYSQNLNQVSNICHSVEKLIESNKTKLDHLQQFSMIANLFSEFYKNLKILYKKWFENVDKNNNTSNRQSSSLIHPIEPISSTSFRSNIEVSSEDHNEINVKNFKEQLQTSSSSDTFQPISSIRKPLHEYNKKFLSFRQLFACLNNLLWSLNNQNLPSYREMVELTISQIEDLQSNIDLCDPRSIFDAEKQISLIKTEYNEKFSRPYIKQHKYKISRKVKESYASMKKTIGSLLRSLHRHQLQMEKDNLIKESIRSSTNSSWIAQNQN
ncbi:unnamed protein product [Rotaria sp. Silwood2]|nr:unnamed protein product [Rotaria sp. Silwood2]CAF2998786.1 unnamed protein product [Rotaria sp. Silwood2]CAF3931576.1 unnamed protein product [Rotaria sp. Silwood2]CAF4187349.1 unnamed protein product [Rotaria sp. Silwood2]